MSSITLSFYSSNFPLFNISLLLHPSYLFIHESSGLFSILPRSWCPFIHPFHPFLLFFILPSFILPLVLFILLPLNLYPFSYVYILVFLSPPFSYIYILVFLTIKRFTDAIILSSHPLFFFICIVFKLLRSL